MGRALANYEGFARRGFYIEGAFDIDPSVVGGKLAGIEIMPVEELAGFFTAFKIDIGIIAVPADAAQDVADTLVDNGVRALWNFAPRRLEVPQTVVLEHVHLSDSLMSLAYRLHKLDVCKNQTAYRC